jgi:hypothetical protein
MPAALMTAAVLAKLGWPSTNAADALLLDGKPL